MRYFQILAAIGMIALLIGHLNRDKVNNSLACVKGQEFNREEYSGKVISKFIDQDNHRCRTILLSTKKKIVLARDTSQFYSFLLNGDSIIKIKNKDYLTLIREGKIYKYKIYFGCDELN